MNKEECDKNNEIEDGMRMSMFLPNFIFGICVITDIRVIVAIITRDVFEAPFFTVVVNMVLLVLLYKNILYFRKVKVDIHLSAYLAYDVLLPIVCVMSAWICLFLNSEYLY